MDFAPSSMNQVLPPGVLILPDAAAVAREAANRFVALAREAIATDGNFTVALSGGQTPTSLYRLLATEAYRSQVNWAKVEVFWTDERAVPPESPESNFNNAWSEFLSRVPIPKAQVHRMHAEDSQIGRAAQAYEELLGRLLRRNAAGFPRFHLILLGIGTDGHTASLFPEPPPSLITSRWVGTPFVAKLSARRMTLTLPILNTADNVMFLVVGAEKAGIVTRVLFGKSEPPLPAQLVQPASGNRIFLLDAAAANLQSTPAESR